MAEIEEKGNLKHNVDGQPRDPLVECTQTVPRVITMIVNLKCVNGLNEVHVIAPSRPPRLLHVPQVSFH